MPIRIRTALSASGTVAACSAGLAAAQGLPPHPPHVTPSQSVIHYDKGVVDQRWHDCRAFSPSGCLFGATAWTWSGLRHGVLYAIDLRKTAGDSCGLGEVYFFDGRRLITSTGKIKPHAQVTYHSHAVSGTRLPAFAVRYAINPSKNAPCVQWGSAGTDTYTYGWNGRNRMNLISGKPPHPPKVLAPSL
jgi:hypothetical protein